MDYESFSSLYKRIFGDFLNILLSLAFFILLLKLSNNELLNNVIVSMSNLYKISELYKIDITTLNIVLLIIVILILMPFGLIINALSYYLLGSIINFVSYLLLKKIPFLLFFVPISKVFLKEKVSAIYNYKDFRIFITVLENFISIKEKKIGIDFSHVDALNLFLRSFAFMNVIYFIYFIYYKNLLIVSILYIIIITTLLILGLTKIYIYSEYFNYIKVKSMIDKEYNKEIENTIKIL